MEVFIASVPHDQVRLGCLIDYREDTLRDHRPHCAAKISELGLQPFRAPEPLPPIGEDEIHLVCWMGVDTASGA